MIILAISHLLKSGRFLSNKVKAMLNDNEIELFQKGLVIPCFLMGVIFISMGIIEHKSFLNTDVFIGGYIALGVMPLILLLVNNKRHLGHYFVI